MLHSAYLSNAPLIQLNFSAESYLPSSKYVYMYVCIIATSYICVHIVGTYQIGKLNCYGFEWS